ncbi:hypothetical protein [Zongyangia hominis]|uniref:CN hydrolase domain-containing protein n=1 Tax=Zongyangia hominis TaxID=2763677 RepID=A0A926EFE0_9FIRM|nr:hypothetical protein [Zongyangia hominis]MBC8570687.1 hypothetical protein [Zongyangia hominis]
MKECKIAVVPPFEKPDPASDLVVFSPAKDYIPEYDTKNYLSQCMEYAMKYAVYLVPSVFSAFDYLCMTLIDREGNILGAQRAVHLNSLSLSHFRKAENLKIFPTELGAIALCVDVDIYHPFQVRMLKMMGAQLLVSAQHLQNRDYNRGRILSGPWNAAQQNNLTVVSVSNKRCCVTAPCEATEDKSGFVVYPTPTLELTASVDVTASAPAIFDYSLPGLTAHGFVKQNAEYLMGGKGR